MTNPSVVDTGKKPVIFSVHVCQRLKHWLIFQSSLGQSCQWLKHWLIFQCSLGQCCQYLKHWITWWNYSTYKVLSSSFFF
jgi:hypothetical protein